jgi:hypothetical protein
MTPPHMLPTKTTTTTTKNKKQSNYPNANKLLVATHQQPASIMSGHGGSCQNARRKRKTSSELRE